MIAKCFRDQNRDMQKFSWNFDILKFDAGFEPKPINCKYITLATRYGLGMENFMLWYRSTRLGDLSRMT